MKATDRLVQDFFQHMQDTCIYMYTCTIYMYKYTHTCIHMYTSMHVYCLRVHTHMVLYNSLRIYMYMYMYVSFTIHMYIPFSPYNVHALIRDEKEGIKKQARSNKQQLRQSNSAHPRYNVVTSPKKMYMYMYMST